MSLSSNIPQDTAGSERYEAMSRIYYRGAKAAIVCYDLTDRNSYERAQFWINELRKNEEVIHYLYNSQKCCWRAGGVILRTGSGYLSQYTLILLCEHIDMPLNKTSKKHYSLRVVIEDLHGY